VDFADAQCEVGNLLETDVPPWTILPCMVPVVEIPESPQRRLKKTETKIVPEIPEDAEMEDVGDPAPEPSTTTEQAKQQQKPSAKGLALQKTSGEVVVASGDEDRSVSSSGAKRTLEDSPSRAENKSKKTKVVPPKKGKAKSKAKAKEFVSTWGDLEVGLRRDLGDLVFDEDTIIDPEMVPMTIGKVCRGVLDVS